MEPLGHHSEHLSSGDLRETATRGVLLKKVF